MISDMTPAVLRALALARTWAELGRVAVEPRHVLLGLLEEDEGRAADLLRQEGAEPATVRMALWDGSAAPTLLAPDLTRPERAVAGLEHWLHRARHVAVDLSGEPTPSSEHLLVAVLREDPRLAQSLESVGVTLARLEARLQMVQ